MQLQLSTHITITDSDGSLITESVDVTALATNVAGVNVNIESLNNLSSLIVTVPFCVTDGSTQCSDSQTIIVPLSIPCPSDITGTVNKSNIEVAFTNNLGSNVSYEITVTDTVTNAVLGTTIIGNPGVDVSHSFSGAIAGKNYSIVVKVTQGSATKTCPGISVLVPGVDCATKYINAGSSTGDVEDIFLGNEAAGEGSYISYWYDPINEKIVTGSATFGPCDAPEIVDYSISSLGTINLTLNFSTYGTESGSSIELSFSTDGLTWSSAESGSDGGRALATNLNSGTVYLRGRTVCPTTYSDYFILRYDFSTDDWLVLANPNISGGCDNNFVQGVCPAGVEVATQLIECDRTSYSVFRGGANSKWYYIGKYQRNGINVYIYAGWDEGHTTGYACTSILECCICPAFILTDTIQIYCQENATSTFKLPYVLGEGVPQMSIDTNPTNGTVTQTTASGNEFTYTNTALNQYADTFTVSLTPSVTGACEEATVTVQIQIIPCARV